MYDKIPPVINYATPNPKVPALLNGKIQIVVDTMPLNSDLISVSCFGFGGSNTHVILQNSKSIPAIKDNHRSSGELNCLDGYQLINLASRSEQGLINGLNKLAQQFRAYDINLNEVYLLNDVVYHEQVKLGFNHTGHIVLNLNNLDEEPMIHVNKEIVNNRNVIDYHKSSERNVNGNNKLFYAFPGLGCQWMGMSVGLLNIPFFYRRLKELCDLIQPDLEFDIYKLMLGELSTADESLDLNDSIFCLIAIAIYQISLLDLLKELGIKPDGYFGHSFGELICAYCDHICTDKQVLEATLVVCKLKQRYDECDKQNKPINNILFEKGQMAVVGLSWADTLKEIDESKVQKVNAACNNSIDCVTVSGVDREVDEFLAHLTSKGIFNRKIASCGMAFHCDLVKDFYDYLLREFNKIFQNQVKRTNKWISTSIDPFSEQESVSWLSTDSTVNRKERQTFAQYFANCILRPVLFKESCEKMVTDLKQHEETIDRVFVLEIAPRSFLSSLMKSNTTKCSSLTYLPGFSAIKRENLYEKPNKNLIVLLNVLGILNENGIYSSLSKLYDQQNDQKETDFIASNGLANGQTNGQIKKKLKTKSSSFQKSRTITQPIITNRLSLSSLINWDHSVDLPVPAYPEFFNTSMNENKIDLNSIEYRHYLLDKTTRFRLPISFYLELIIKQFKKKYGGVQFSTVHIQDLIVYRLEELNEEELENLSIEVIEFSENSNLGQIYVFLIRNHEDKLILNGNLAVSTIKIKHLDQLDQEDFAKQLSCDKFYEELRCLDSRYRLIKNKLSISTDRIIAQSSTDEWTKQLDSLIQLYAYHNKQSMTAEIDKQTLQIHSITIELQQTESTGDHIMFDNQMNFAQSKQVELKCIRLNSLINDRLDDKLTVDQNNNIEFKNKRTVVDELSRQELSVKYFKINSQINLTFVGHRQQNEPVLGLLSKDDKFNKMRCWSFDGKTNGLSHLSLLNGYLIAYDLLNRKCKLNYTVESAFLNCEENLDLLIGLCDLLLLQNCDVYVLLKDQVKTKVLRDCFSSRNNLHILTTADPSNDDFDLELLSLTNGEGSQLVISKSTGKHEFNKSVNCLSLNGKFIHLNNEETCVQNLPLGMALFLKNIDFQGITLHELDLDEIINSHKHEKISSILSSINPTIIQTLDQLNQLDLEQLFNSNFIYNL